MHWAKLEEGGRGQSDFSRALLLHDITLLLLRETLDSTGV